MEKIEFFQSISALKNFSMGFLSKLAQVAEKECAKEDEIIFQESDQSDYLYIIEKGEVIITKKVSPETEKILSILCEGNIFGEMSLFSDKPRTASAKAKTEVLYYKIHRNEFRKLFAIDPQGTQKMLESLLLSTLERLEHTSRELATVYEISKIIVKNLSLEEFCEEIIKQLCYSIPEVDNGLFFVWNEFTEEYESKKISIPKDHRIILFLSDKAEATTFEEEIEILPAKSYIIAPLIKEKLTGFILLANTKKEVVFSQGTKDLLNSVALQILGAIENIKVQQEKLNKERFDRIRTRTITW
ncbi:MAG: cyclic nucleotide-binding domain-containing protein [Endomicrobiia bacterium]